MALEGAEEGADSDMVEMTGQYRVSFLQNKQSISDLGDLQADAIDVLTYLTWSYDELQSRDALMSIVTKTSRPMAQVTRRR
jgi:hypothetical protein